MSFDLSWIGFYYRYINLMYVEPDFINCEKSLNFLETRLKSQLRIF